MDKNKKISIFDYLDYRKYISDNSSHEALGKGFRGAMSKFLNCHSSLISTILKGANNFTPEQAIKLSEFLKLDKNEAHYFVLLIQYERAGNYELKSYYLNQINQIKENENIVEKKIKITPQKPVIPEESIYYMEPYIQLVHMGLTIERFLNQRSLLWQELGLNSEQWDEIISKLEKIGILEIKNGKIIIKKKIMQLDSNSIVQIPYQTIARLRSINKLSSQSKKDIFKSVTFSASKETEEKIKLEILELFSKLHSLVIRDQSEPKNILQFNLDFVKWTS